MLSLRNYINGKVYKWVLSVIIKMTEKNQPDESLRDLLDEKELKELRGRNISIILGRIYDRQKFVSAMGDYTGLQKDYMALKENSGDTGAMDNIAGLLNPKNPNLILDQGLEGVLTAADAQLSASGTDMAKYAERYSLVDKLSGEPLNALVLQLGNPNHPLLYKSDDKEHRKLAEIVKKMRKVQSGKIEELAEDIPELMNAPSLEGVPAWHQALFARYGNNQAYLQGFLKSYASVISAIYAKAFTRPGKGNDKGKRVPNATKLLQFYDENLKVVEDTISREDNDEEKRKIWDKSIKPIDLMVAGLLYDAEKQRLKDDLAGEDSEEGRAAARKRKRAEQGVRS